MKESIQEKKAPNPAYALPDPPKDTNPLAVHQYYMAMSDYHDRHAGKHMRLRGLQKLWSDSRNHHDDRHNFHKAMRDGYAQKALQIDIRGESQQSSGFGKMKEDYSSDDMSHARDIAMSHGYRPSRDSGALVHNITRHELFIGQSGKWAHFAPDGGRKLASGDDLGRMRQHLTSLHKAKSESSATESCECPKCGSHNTSTYDDSDREKCADCGHVFVESEYKYQTPSGGKYKLVRRDDPKGKYKDRSGVNYSVDKSFSPNHPEKKSEAFSGTAPTGVLKVQSAPNLKLLQPKAPDKKVAVGSTKYDTSKVRKAVEDHLSLDSLLRY